MSLKEFLKNRPQLVNDLKKCKTSEEVKKILQTNLSEQDLNQIDTEELKKMTEQDLENVSGGFIGILAGAAIGIGIGFIISDTIFKMKHPTILPPNNYPKTPFDHQPPHRINPDHNKNNPKL